VLCTSTMMASDTKVGWYHLKNPWLKAHAVAGCQQGGTRA
jgi:hypothetical protein